MAERIMVVHPGPQFSVADVHDGWIDGLRAAGAKVQPFPLDDMLCFFGNALLPDTEAEERNRAKIAFPDNDMVATLATKHLEAAVLEMWPEVVFIVSAFFVKPWQLDLFRQRGMKVVLLCTEQPYELDREISLAQHCDMVILNDPTHQALFRQVTDAWYSPHCYRPEVHHPGPVVERLRCDLGWVGTAYPSRVEFFEQLDLDGLVVRFGGNWQGIPDGHRFDPFLLGDKKACLPNSEATDLYRSCKLSLNTYRVESQRPELADGWSMGPREVELAATGCFFLRQHRPESDDVLSMLPGFDTAAEASDLLRWWVADDRADARAEASRKAAEAVEDRTFAHAATRFLRRLERL